MKADRIERRVQTRYIVVGMSVGVIISFALQPYVIVTGDNHVF